MEAILNQPEEDVIVNTLIIRIKLTRENIESNKRLMDSYYQRYLKSQASSKEYHILQYGKPILYYEDDNFYFCSTLNLRKELVLLQTQIDRYVKEIAEMETELDGRTWKYIETLNSDPAA